MLMIRVRRAAPISMSVALWFLLPGRGHAQEPAPAAEVITRAALARDAARLAEDSLRGGDSVSSAREAAARYVADQFRRLGLSPLRLSSLPSEKVDFIRPYPLPGQQRFNATSSALWLRVAVRTTSGNLIDEGGNEVTRQLSANFATDARFLPDVGPAVVGENVGASNTSDPEVGSSRVILVAGPHTTATLDRLDLHDKVALYVPPAGLDTAARRQVLTRLYRESRGVIVAAAEDSATFARLARGAADRHVVVVDKFLAKAAAEGWPWAATLRFDLLRSVLAPVADLDRARTTPTPMADDLPFTEAWLRPVIDSPQDPVTVPNVVGVLEGTDSALKREYIVVASRLGADRPARAATDSAGSFRNAPVDDPTGFAALLALARALHDSAARPRRSILFLAAGGADELSGSWAFADAMVGHLNDIFIFTGVTRRPYIVAAFAIDPLGRMTNDTVVIDGSRDVAALLPPAWVAAAHPELGLAVRDGGPAFRPGPALPFARYGIPSLAVRPAAPPSTGAAPGVTDRTARVVQGIFHLVQGLANTPQRVTWTEAGREAYRRQLRTRSEAPPP